MTSKILTNKLGLKSAPSKPESDQERLRRENAALRKRLEESGKAGERSRAPEQRLDAPRAKPKDPAPAPPLEVRRSPIEVRRPPPDVPHRVHFKTGNPSPVQGPSSAEATNNAQILEAQLKDALEKNQQWLVYDQSREVYVQGLMARIFDLEQQVTSGKQTKDGGSEGKEEETKKHYDKLLLDTKKDLEEERVAKAQVHAELAHMKIQLEEKKKEAAELSAAMRSQADTGHQQREEDRQRMRDKVQKLKSELEVYRELCKSEKRKNAELTKQMEEMQSSLRRQQEDQQKVVALEQQIQRCTSDLENEKADRRNVQHQLDKVLKELRKTREEITKLEPGKRDIYYIDTSGNFASEFENRLSLRGQQPSPKTKSTLDESFLECPRCRVVYPTSQHRELLAHLDFCTS